MDIQKLLIFVPALVLAASFHEAAHGWMAYRFGDPTAKELGRITLNPIKHIDPLFSILLPAILVISGSGIIFGGAKPVPFSPQRMRPGTNIKKAIMWVAAAGPLSNFLLAFISLFLFSLLRESFGYAAMNGIAGKSLEAFYLVNLILGTFNLLPIPPLDGAKVLAGFLPDRAAITLYRLERYAMIFIMLIIISPIGRFIVYPIIALDTGFRAVVSLLVW